MGILSLTKIQELCFSYMQHYVDDQKLQEYSKLILACSKAKSLDKIDFHTNFSLEQIEKIISSFSQGTLASLQQKSVKPILPPIVIICGECKRNQLSDQINFIFSEGLRSNQYRIYLSGGTDIGICGAVGKARKNSKKVYLIGFTPKKNEDDTVSPHNVPLDSNYDEIRFSDGVDFSEKEVCLYWKFIEEEMGMTAQNVLLVGAGGGNLSKLEYEIALEKGATVLLIKGSGRSADEILMSSSEKYNGKLLELNIADSPKNLQNDISKLLIKFGFFSTKPARFYKL